MVQMYFTTYLNNFVHTKTSDNEDKKNYADISPSRTVRNYELLPSFDIDKNSIPVCPTSSIFGLYRTTDWFQAYTRPTHRSYRNMAT